MPAGGAFDPYAAGKSLPRPGRLSVAKHKSGEYILRLPKPDPLVNERIVFLETDVHGTEAVYVSASDKEVSCCPLPEGVRVAAFLVDETKQGDRSPGGPVLYFWTEKDET